MKLESAALKGKDVLELEPIVRGNVLDTTQMLVWIFENRQKHAKENLAYSAHAYLARGLATLAIANAKDDGVKAIGFSGGAACNEILAQVMRKTVEASGLKFFVHCTIPPGDGGLSFGQAVVGGFFQV
jgi:hydrogenase maturation protein HypF